jgi:hypothetical protein
MVIAQKQWTGANGWKDLAAPAFPAAPQLVLLFGARSLVETEKCFNEVRKFYPQSRIVVCSTAGEILGDQVSDNSLAVTAIYFTDTKLEFAEADIVTADDSLAVGQKLAGSLPKDKLKHVLVFSDGLRVNGTQLVAGLNTNLPNNVSVTGGLVGDGAEFKKTAVGLDHAGQEGKIVLVGFYGDRFKVGYGSLGGWDEFGVERTITKAKGNILYELDNKPALALYKTYLGDKASGLPSTALLFPLKLKLKKGHEIEVVRTILGVNEAEQSLTFAGDMPEGAQVALMKANFERLIDGASGAGAMSLKSLGAESPPDLAILISCVGRKLVLKERIEEEVEAVRAAIGPQAVMTGFYSYGELCPIAATEKKCRLHNQTMTITLFKESG